MKSTVIAISALALASSGSARVIRKARGVDAAKGYNSDWNDAPAPTTSSYSSSWEDTYTSSSAWEDSPAPTYSSYSSWEDTPAPSSTYSSWEDSPEPTYSSHSSWADAPAPTYSSYSSWEDTPAPTTSTYEWSDAPAPSSTGSAYTLYYDTKYSGSSQQYSNAEGAIYVTLEDGDVLISVEVKNPADDANCVVKDDKGNQIRAFGGPAQDIDSIKFVEADGKQAASISCVLA